MICPHCHETIDATGSSCPACGELLDREPDSLPTEFIFCEGCGARLSPHDRTCPKCGRPAPGILSSSAAAADLAAGRTASFPRLTKAQFELAEMRDATSAAELISDAADPNATTIMAPIDGIDPKPAAKAHPNKQKKKKKTHQDEDAYHKHRRQIPKRLILVFLLIVCIAGGYAFVSYDPLGVMPEFYREFGKAAKEMFPSRQRGEASAADTGGADSSAGSSDDDNTSSTDVTEVSDTKVLDGDELYDYLESLYQDVISYSDSSEIGQVIDDFNGGYLLSSLDERKTASESAYSLRDRVQQTLDELDDIKTKEDSAYASDIKNLRQLAQWMHDRVDAICASWDVSLGIAEGESVSSHQNEILKPLQEAGNTALEQFDAYRTQYRPRKHSS